MAALLASLAADAPVLLVLDDLHRADPSSADLMSGVLASLPEARLLVAATLRPGEIAADAPVAEALSRLNQEGLVERLELAGRPRRR